MNAVPVDVFVVMVVCSHFYSLIESSMINTFAIAITPTCHQWARTQCQIAAVRNIVIISTVTAAKPIAMTSTALHMPIIDLARCLISSLDSDMFEPLAVFIDAREGVGKIIGVEYEPVFVSGSSASENA